MTRINLIPPGLLLDQHLMAEYRELPMVHAALSRSVLTQSWLSGKYKIPARYTLGTGHVKFFYYKSVFLYERYAALTRELLRRGFNLNDPEDRCDWSVFDLVPPSLEDDLWKPTARDVRLNVARIVQRVNQRPGWYRYRGKIVSSGRYEQLLIKRGLHRA